MSLINRMLDDLAARQAPGAEALGGVRLAAPLSAAHASLSAQRMLLLLVLALAAGFAVWWLWLRPPAVSAPQVRGADSTATADAVVAADPSPLVAAERESARVAEVVAAETATLGASPRMALQLDSRLDLAAIAPPAEPAAPRSAPTTPPAIDPPRAAPSASTAPRRDPPPPAPAEPQVAEPALATPTPDAAQQARDALARGEAQAALDALGAGPDADADRAALRAAALQRLGRHAEAAEAYGSLSRRDPEQVTHWVGLAISLEALDRGSEAGMAYRRALVDPRLAPSLRAFAQTRLKAMESE